MQLKIEIYESPDFQIGKMSRKAYNNIPKNKRPDLYAGDFFLIGDLERPSISIKIVDDSSLDENSMYLHQRAKDEYYPKKNSINL